MTNKVAFDVYAKRHDGSVVQLASGIAHESAIILNEHAWSLVGDSLPYRNAWLKSGSERTRRTHRKSVFGGAEHGDSIKRVAPVADSSNLSTPHTFDAK